MNEGRLWQPCGIRTKLKNPAYTGVFRFGDIEYRDHHPAIIPVADFEQVQRSLNERQRLTTPKADAGGFLLTRLIRCGKCGAPMTGKHAHKSHYYRCTGAIFQGPNRCDGNTVKQRELVDRFCEQANSRTVRVKT